MSLSLRTSLFVCAIVTFVALASAQEQARVPVPRGAALDAAEQAIAAPYRLGTADNSRSARKSIAQRLVADSAEPKLGTTERYVMLVRALDLSRGASDVETAFAAIDHIADQYEVEPAYRESQKIDFVVLRASKVPGPEAPAMAARGVELLEQSVRSGKLDDSVRLLKPVQAAVDKAKDDALKARVDELKADVTEYEQVLRPALLALAENAAQPEVNLEVGRYYATFLGDFEKALPYLARSSDEEARKLAIAEQAAPTDAKAQFELAAGWLEYGKKQPGRRKANVLAHAQSWYERAFPNLENVDVLTAKLQMEELDALLLKVGAPTESAAAPKPTSSGLSAKTPKPVRTAILDGLSWLARHQDEDGGWSGIDCVENCPGEPCWFDDSGANFNRVGVTSLALLAFLDAGYGADATDEIEDPGHERRLIIGTDVVEKALHWLEGEQQDDGSFTDGDTYSLYNEAIATLALTRAYELTGDVTWKGMAQDAVDLICSAQKPSPVEVGRKWGWRYSPGPSLAEDELPDALGAESDMSVTGWMVRALQAALQRGLDVPQESLDGALDFAKYCTAKGESGWVGYLDPGRAGAPVMGKKGTERYRYHMGTMSAIGMCIRIALEDDDRNPFLSQAADQILRDLPVAGEDNLGVDYYYWHHGTLALNQFDESGAKRYSPPWNKAVEEVVLSMQDRREGACTFGGWITPDCWSYGHGPVYTTAINVLTLEACYD